MRLNTSARPNGVVRAAAAGPSGSWYVGGDFTKVGKSNRLGAAKISSNGSLASGWNPQITGSVRTIAVAGDVVYLGGSFSAVGGASRSNLAAVDASGALLPWNPGADGPVDALAVSTDGATVFAGGSFGQAGGASRSNLAAISAPPARRRRGAPARTVRSRACRLTDGATVFAGGSFGQAGGASRSNLAALDASTGAPSGDIRARTRRRCQRGRRRPGRNVPCTRAAHSATSAARRAPPRRDRRGRRAQPRRSTRAQAARCAPCRCRRRCTAVRGRGLHDARWPSPRARGRRRHRERAVDAWEPRADASVRAIAASGTKAYVGGDFTMLNGAPRNNVAAIDAATGEVDLGWNANANAKLRALAAAPDGQTIYLGGSFFKVGGLPRDKVAAVSATTGAPTSWKPNANREVKAIAAVGDTVWIGGVFTQIGGTANQHLAAVGATSGLVLDGFDADTRRHGASASTFPPTERSSTRAATSGASAGAGP